MNHTLCRAAALLLTIAAVAPAQSSHTLYNVDGTKPHDLLGFAVDGLGDVDNDGRPDFAAGCFGANKETGEVRIFSGATGIVLRAISGDGQGDRFGYALAGVGDVNRDGVPDIVVGACRDDDNGADSGSAKVFSGKDGTVLHTFLGDSAGDEFGTAVAAAGDVNNDGHADVIVGSPLDDPNGADSGSAKVFSGKDGTVLHTFTGDSAHDWFGYSVAGAGDVNQDGFADLIVGVTYDDSGAMFNNGSAKIYSGRDGAGLQTFRGLASSDWFGLSVAGAGDVDRDGFDDVIVGASSHDTTGKNAGMATVFSGRNGKILHRLYGKNAGDEFGVCVAGAGDADGDGRADVVVGAYRGNGLHAQGGSVYVFSGRNGKLLHESHGTAPDNRFGISVASVGDMTGDGMADVIAGAVYADRTATNAGAARVISVTALTLVADPTTMSAANGGTQTMTLEAGPDRAGLNYQIVGSATGTSPGTNLGRGMILPIVYDSYSDATVDYANSPEFAGFRGRLDPRGRATARLNIPSNRIPSAVGRTIYHAYFTYNDKGRVQSVSNPVALTFTQ